MSVAPPGAYGTTIFTVFDGYLSCAEAVTEPNTRCQQGNDETEPYHIVPPSDELGPAFVSVGGFPRSVD